MTISPAMPTLAPLVPDDDAATQSSGSDGATSSFDAVLAHHISRDHAIPGDHAIPVHGRTPRTAAGTTEGPTVDDADSPAGTPLIGAPREGTADEGTAGEDAPPTELAAATPTDAMSVAADAAAERAVASGALVPDVVLGELITAELAAASVGAPELAPSDIPALAVTPPAAPVAIAAFEANALPGDPAADARNGTTPSAPASAPSAAPGAAAAGPDADADAVPATPAAAPPVPGPASPVVREEAPLYVITSLSPPLHASTATTEDATATDASAAPGSTGDAPLDSGSAAGGGAPAASSGQDAQPAAAQATAASATTTAAVAHEAGAGASVASAPGVPAATTAMADASTDQPLPPEVPVTDQVTRHLLSARTLRDGTQHTVIHLSPDHLGRVTVTVDVQNGAVRLELAAGDAALAALRTDLGTLREQLAGSGLDLSDVTLRLQNAEPQQGRGDEQQRPAEQHTENDRDRPGRSPVADGAATPSSDPTATASDAATGEAPPSGPHLDIQV